MHHCGFAQLTRVCAGRETNHATRDICGKWPHLRSACGRFGLKTVWYTSQGRLDQWAHWACAQGPRIIFFFLRGPQLAVVK